MTIDPKTPKGFATTARPRNPHHLIGEGLVRLSVGLEDGGDMLYDLRQALDAA